MSVFSMASIDMCYSICLLELVPLVPEWLLWFQWQSQEVDKRIVLVLSPSLKWEKRCQRHPDRYALMCCWLELVCAVPKPNHGQSNETSGAGGGLSLLWRTLPLQGVQTKSGLFMGKKKCMCVCWWVGEEGWKLGKWYGYWGREPIIPILSIILTLSVVL